MLQKKKKGGTRKAGYSGRNSPEPCSSNTVIAGKDLVLEIQVSIVSREEYEMHMEKPSDLIETGELIFWQLIIL